MNYIIHLGAVVIGFLYKARVAEESNCATHGHDRNDRSRNRDMHSYGHWRSCGRHMLSEPLNVRSPDCDAGEAGAVPSGALWASWRKVMPTKDFGYRYYVVRGGPVRLGVSSS